MQVRDKLDFPYTKMSLAKQVACFRCALLHTHTGLCILIAVYSCQSPNLHVCIIWTVKELK